MLRPGAQTLDVPAELLGERPAAWTLVDAELGRRESVERIAVLEKLRAADAQEIARLQALVRSEQTRLQAEVDTARDAVRQQEVRHEHEIASLRALLRSEQARLHAELDEIRSISDLAGGHEEP
jgi:DNA-binding helix-hairpin-helix protein with protein kinase domain